MHPPQFSALWQIWSCPTFSSRSIPFTGSTVFCRLLLETQVIAEIISLITAVREIEISVQHICSSSRHCSSYMLASWVICWVASQRTLQSLE